MELEDKMEKSQLCAPRDKKHKDWETDFLWNPDLQKANNIGLLLNDRELVSGYLILTLGNFAYGFPRHKKKWPSSSWSCKIRWSVVCMTGLYLSA